ncbi:MAG TPA: hypothetical protein VL358_01085 [Caulobacteraceae bacterium]|nr:hypothetical protein [Caulobacteraceae bacterium]
MCITNELERCWPWLAAAAARGRERGLTKVELGALLLAGRAMLWPGEDGALVTQCLITPEGQFLHCWLGGGSLRTLLALRPGVEAWGRAMGCEQASIDGRKGWDRMCRPLGYRRVGNELRKTL